MTSRAKKLLIVLLFSIVILILSAIFRPFEPEDQTFETPPPPQTDSQELPDF